ncbi:MAG TPA: protein kinase [Pyrinomonadaceae bacterium]|nr:protein kinase [Pyrinomonadaceae bacterium]
MPIAAGTDLGRYEIRSKIGAGGMGEVYLARDTKLERTVALKILPADVAADRQRMQRFIQEAKTASSLNHPNILTIFEVEQVESTHFIVTEFIDGETLRQYLKVRRMKIAEALALSVQIASALSAAHAAGIIHRDIKPENIMRRRDGIVKVVDFGLAKPSEKTDTGDVDTEAATKALVQTEPGVVMGTAAYMSPEQARGVAVDARTDIFSLGVVIYEMVAGLAPFGGMTSSDLMVALLEREPPPLARFTPEAPAELERIVMKALAKDRDERYQTAKDLLIDLRRLKQKLDVESEIERSAAPELRSAGGEIRPPDGRVAVLTASGAVAQTALAGVRTNSSAEYIISEIKRHKRVALLALAALVAMTGVVAYFAYSRHGGGSSGVAIRSIAVLPFANTGGNPDTEYLSDGISESLINSLSQLPGMKVIARSSSFRYKGRDVDPQEVANALGVEAILTGRVLQRGDNLLISVELMNARDKTQMWGEQYNRMLTDILVVQQEISREVSEKLRLKLTGEERQRISKPYTESAEAYELYLKGRYFYGKTTEDGLKKAIEYYQQAIDKDPDYALAYVGMGNSFRGLGGSLGFASPGSAAPQAKAVIMKALAIDDTLPDAHAALADFKLNYDWDWPGAEREYKRALELNPNQASAHHGYGTYLQSLSRFDEAVGERERSRQLDPTSPNAIANVGYPLYYARRFDQALEHYRKALELDPVFSWGHLFIGQVYVQQGRYEEAIAEIKKAIASSEGNVRDVATLGHAYAVAGKRSEALKILAELQERAKQKYVSPYFIALVYVGLGEKDQAFAWLEKAYQERHPYLILIKVEPVFDVLRSDPRFQDLVQRIGLPQ